MGWKTLCSLATEVELPLCHARMLITVLGLHTLSKCNSLCRTMGAFFHLYPQWMQHCTGTSLVPTQIWRVLADVVDVSQASGASEDHSTRRSWFALA